MNQVFRFYIVAFNGTVVGTDSSKAAQCAAQDEDIVAVIDTTNNTDLTASETVRIQQQSTYPE